MFLFLLYGNVNQLYVCTRLLPPSLTPSLQVITEHRAEPPVLRSSFPLAMHFTHGRAFTLAWEIPWTEEPGGLQSMGSRRVESDTTDMM